MSSVFSLLPLVLVHQDFSFFNIIVDETSGRLAGVIDWAEAEICPFGQNLGELQEFSATLHQANGRRLYQDHEVLHARFWRAFRDEAGELSP